MKIAQVGSFQTAAEQLNMTLSALSMQMKALETELDVALFDRKVRPPRLTPLGRAIVDKAAQVVASETALLDLCVRDDALVGNFRIGFVTSAAARLLPTFLENTQRDMPRARFDFETGLSKGLQAKVLTGNLDLAVVTGTEIDADRLSQVVLREEPFVFAAHRAISGQGLETLLAAHTFFHFMPQTGIGQLIADAMGPINPEARTTRVMLDNLEAIMGCVKAGLGFTLLPAPDVNRYADKDLVKFPAPPGIHRALVLITRSGDFDPKRIDLIVAQFQAVRPEDPARAES